MSFCHPWVIALAFGLAAAAPAAQASSVDLLLVLAVDASGSVEDDEYALQLRGIAAGFRDPAVREAIRAGPRGRVAVDLLTWAEPRVPKDQTGWYVIADDKDAEAFARLVESLPRGQNGATGLGEGIAAAVRAITESGLTASRRVIDVSGDGEETPARDYVVQLPQARIMAQSYDITINGLAIENEATSLRLYYRDKLISGPGSFVMAVRGYEDFAEAMRRKLLREIQDRPEMSLLR